MIPFPASLNQHICFHLYLLPFVTQARPPAQGHQAPRCLGTVSLSSSQHNTFPFAFLSPFPSFLFSCLWLAVSTGPSGPP